MISSSFVVAALALSLAHPLLAQGGSPPRAGQRVVFITGSTDGLGREVAMRLAEGGAHVIVHGRNRERGAQVVEEIMRGGKGTARFYAADLASLAQVRALADTILRDYPRIDVLVNNAGVWMSENRRALSADGHEMHFAVNYLAGYVLTRALLPRLVQSAPARIINVASTAQQPIDFADVMLERGYSDGRGYAQSKLAQVRVTKDLAAELAGRNIIVAALHPATMMNTTMVLSRQATPRATVEQGAAAVMHLIGDPGIGNGEYYSGTTIGRPNAQALDSAARAQLKRLSEDLSRPR
jgi:NAD(P)-dependent dehydrogenase (short-subunit alcohol dehydrogenase family)